MTKQEIRIEMLKYLTERLHTFFAANESVDTQDAFGDEISFTIPSSEIAAETDRILQSASAHLRIVSALLNSNPERLERFADEWLGVAQTFIDKQADEVTAELTLSLFSE